MAIETNSIIMILYSKRERERERDTNEEKCKIPLFLKLYLKQLGLDLLDFSVSRFFVNFSLCTHIYPCHYSNR